MPTTVNLNMLQPQRHPVSHVTTGPSCLHPSLPSFPHQNAFVLLLGSLCPDAQCRNTTRCNETTFQSLQATATRDRNCTRLAECTLGQSYEIQAPFRASGNLARFVVYTSNRVCSPVRACLSGAEYQLQAATLTSNAVCRAFTACNASQIEVVPATATSDRVVSFRLRSPYHRC